MENKTRIILLAVFVIIVISIAYWQTYSYQEKRAEKIQEYKKAFYSAMLCEYNCPLTNQKYQNKTQLLPEARCVKNCTKSFKANYSNLTFSKQELQIDDLFKDLEAAIKKCRAQTVNATSLSVNNTFYFSCSAEEIAKLKGEYGYLSEN